MRIFEFIDYLQRRINSLLFRIVLILYSIFILANFEGIFNIALYLIGIILYLFVYIYLLKSPRIRLLNDLIFISFILLGKDPNKVIIFVFLLLPIVNSINFSGNKKSHLLYIYIFIIYIALTCFYSHKYEPEFVVRNAFPIVSLFFLWCIDLYTSLRTKIRTFRESLNEIVDSFYLDKETIKKPHKIYTSLIEVINKNIQSNLVEELLCFIVIKALKR